MTSGATENTRLELVAIDVHFPLWMFSVLKVGAKFDLPL